MPILPIAIHPVGQVQTQHGRRGPHCVTASDRPPNPSPISNGLFIYVHPFRVQRIVWQGIMIALWCPLARQKTARRRFKEISRPDFCPMCCPFRGIFFHSVGYLYLAVLLFCRKFTLETLFFGERWTQSLNRIKIVLFGSCDKIFRFSLNYLSAGGFFFLENQYLKEIPLCNIICSYIRFIIFCNNLIYLL